MHILRFDTPAPGYLLPYRAFKIFTALGAHTVLIHSHADEYIDMVALPPYNQKGAGGGKATWIGMLRLIKELGKR
jgi:hypothetical protein